MTPLEIFESIWVEQAPSIPLIVVVNSPVNTDTLPDVWGAAIYQPEAREDVTLGSTPWVEESGTFLIGLLARAGTGPAVLDDAVATIRQAFHGAARDGLVVFAVDGPHDVDPEADGEWWRLVLTARYTFQTVRQQTGPLYHGWQGFDDQP
jgi:hypothetical protein